jgi:hypothetical protein
MMLIGAASIAIAVWGMAGLNDKIVENAWAVQDRFVAYGDQTLDKVDSLLASTKDLKIVLDDLVVLVNTDVNVTGLKSSLQVRPPQPHSPTQPPVALELLLDAVCACRWRPNRMPPWMHGCVWAARVLCIAPVLAVGLPSHPWDSQPRATGCECGRATTCICTAASMPAGGSHGISPPHQRVTHPARPGA